MSRTDPTRPVPAGGPKAGTPRPKRPGDRSGPTRPVPAGPDPGAADESERDGNASRNDYGADGFGDGAYENFGREERGERGERENRDDRDRTGSSRQEDPYPDNRHGGAHPDPGSAMGKSKARKPKKRHPFRGLLIALTVILVTTGIAVGGAWVWLQGAVGPVTVREICTGTFSDGSSHTLELDQANNAAIITGIAEKRNFPVRAATIGVATAIQESKLRNITYGDRDSLGLFQQRPSQGWGTKAELLDPVYATNAFYDELEKIGDLDELTITEAAQKVQRSAYPEAYADHEPEARMVVSPLAGYSPGGWNCVLKEDKDLTAQTPGDNGLTDRAKAVRTAAKTELGRTKSKIDAAGTGLTFTVPADADDRHAWALASWALARADELGVKQVAIDGHRWDRSSSSDGWVTAETGLGARQVLITVY